MGEERDSHFCTHLILQAAKLSGAIFSLISELASAISNSSNISNVTLGMIFHYLKKKKRKGRGSLGPRWISQLEKKKRSQIPEREEAKTQQDSTSDFSYAVLEITWSLNVWKRS